MKIFDVRSFLDDHGVPYTEGGNPDWINTECVVCGDNSNKNHLGCNTTSGAVHCWRNCGATTRDLVEYYHGNDFKGVFKKYSTITSFQNKIERASYIVPRGKKLEVPGTKKPNKFHRKYFRSRGYPPSFLPYMINQFDLRFTDGNEGVLSNRIVFPVYYNNRAVTYQTRSVMEDAKIRYLAAKPEFELIPIKKLFYNLQNAIGDRVLLVEGIFDVLNFKGVDNVICSFGTSITAAQVSLLASKYREVFVLFDQEEEAQKKARELVKELMMRGVTAVNLVFDDPKYDGMDPGDLPSEAILEIVNSLNIF